MPKISLVIPVYNEEKNVRQLHGEVISVLKGIESSFEIIFVNDGSTDGTLGALKDLTPATVIDLRKNFGQSASLDAGIKHASGEVIITMDGDRQNDPADIPRLLEKMNEGFDVVCGWRYDRKDPLLKRFFSRGAEFLRRMLISDVVHDAGCALRAHKKECFASVDLYGEMHRFIPALLALQGFRIAEIKTNHRPRVAGTTKYNWHRLLRGFIDLVGVWFWQKYAARPQHLFGGLGLLCIALGIVAGSGAVYLKFEYGYDLSDTALTLFAVFMVLAGVQFFITGLLADIAIKHYYSGVSHRPYAIREIIVNDARRDA